MGIMKRGYFGNGCDVQEKRFRSGVTKERYVLCIIAPGTSVSSLVSSKKHKS
jgi:hypothetical protein